MAKRRIKRIVGIVLIAATALWIAALFGFASGYLSDDPPLVNPYSTSGEVGWFSPPPSVSSF